MPERVLHLSQVNLRLRRGPVVIGDVVYAPGGSFGPRVQRDYQLVVVHRGSLNLSLDSESVEVPKNHGVLLSPGRREHFRFAPDRETHHSWLAIKPGSVPIAARRHFSKFGGPAPILGRTSTLLELCLANAFAWHEQASLQDELYLGLGLALLCEFSCFAREEKAPESSSEVFLARMSEFISREYRRPLSLGEIAGKTGVSRQHLLKLCRLHGKPSPMKQLYAKRLEVSADLLLHTGLSIGEIADRTGFVNVFHFSRKFKQAYDQSPLAWRNKAWKAQPA